MFHGEVSDWMTPPAIAIPSTSRRARQRPGDWLGLRWVTVSIPWSRPVRAASMVMATGSAPRGPQGRHQGCQDQLVTEIVGAEPPGDGDPSSHWMVRPATSVSLRSLAMRSGVTRVSG